MPPTDDATTAAARRVRAGFLSECDRDAIAHLLDTVDECLTRDIDMPLEVRAAFAIAVDELARREAGPAHKEPT